MNETLPKQPEPFDIVAFANSLFPGRAHRHDPPQAREEWEQDPQAQQEYRQWLDESYS